MLSAARAGLVLFTLVAILGPGDASELARPGLGVSAKDFAPAPEKPRLPPSSPAAEATPAHTVSPPPAAAGPRSAAEQSQTVGEPLAAVPEPVKVSSDPRPTLSPETFVATMRAVERYRQLAEAGGWAELPSGTMLKIGHKGANVAILKRRLAATGDLPADATPGDLFDEGLVEAVKRFQARHGLPETGLVLARTLAALNVPAETRAHQLTASAGRLIGSKFAFGERYVTVNIPSATAEAVQNGSVVRRYVAVVGKPDRPSPVVETRITNINFNPTWTVPVSLIKKDIIPHMRKDPGYLAKMKIHALDANGLDVYPAKIDWSTEQAANYTLRQDPGVANSLGEVRIDMPNRHAVYMHDTPSKRLFARNIRFESSGCVRVAGVRNLVVWLLEGTPTPPATNTGSAPAITAVSGPGPAWTAPDVDAAIASAKRHDVKLAKAIPVAWVYLTGYATSDGTVHFRDDPYNLDAPQPKEPFMPDPVATGSIAKRP